MPEENPSAPTGLVAASAQEEDPAAQEQQTPLVAPSEGDAADQNKSVTSADGQPYRPDGLPTELAGETDQQTIDRLLEGYASRDPGTVPDGPDKYDLTLPDEVTAALGDMADDPMAAVWREVAHKHGVSNEKFSAMFGDFIAGGLENGVLAKPIDVNAAWSELGKAAGGDAAARITAGKQRGNSAAAAIKSQVGKGVISEDQGAMLIGLAGSPDGVRLIEKLVVGGASPGLQGGGSGAAGGVSKADVKKRYADPRNNPLGPEYDPAFYQQTQQMAKQAYSRKK